MVLDRNECEHPAVVEGAKSQVGGAEGGIVGQHRGRGNVIEPDRNAGPDALDPDAMQLVLVPFAARCGLGRDHGEWLPIDNEDLVCFWIGLTGEVHVVVVTRILEPEENAKVAVPIIASRLHELGFEEEIAEAWSGQQRDVAG